METNSTAHPARRILIGRIETVAIGPVDAALDFAARLASENGWTAAFARRVEFEYRRFLALVATGDEPLTPSDAVDQAWHLHLTYTRDYWDGLCRDIVAREIHHEPTSGGPEQREHYRDRYARTLERYRATFDAAPPADIWPDPSERFAAIFQRVDRTRTMLAGSEAMAWIGVVSAGLAVLIALGRAGAAAVLLSGIAIAAFVCALRLGAGRARRRSDSDFDGDTESDGSDAGGSDGCGSGCGGGCS